LSYAELDDDPYGDPDIVLSYDDERIPSRSEPEEQAPAPMRRSAADAAIDRTVRVMISSSSVFS
jgi:hypothetical protein